MLLTSSIENGIVSRLIFGIGLPHSIINKVIIINITCYRNSKEELQLANSSQARKRARQGETRRRHNASFKSMVRTCVKKVEASVDEGDQAQASAAYKEAVPVIDRMADKGIIHKNKAARLKSRLNTRVKKLK